jgi:hypothetical protein
MALGTAVFLMEKTLACTISNTKRHFVSSLHPDRVDYDRLMDFFGITTRML